MRAFTCRHCHELVAFESPGCARCGRPLGFDPLSGALESLEGSGADLVRTGTGGPSMARCRLYRELGCNWLVPAEQAGTACLSCSLTASRPPLGQHEYRAACAKAEVAKRRLIYQLLQLHLPVVGAGASERALSFALLAGESRVVTGHCEGVVTLDLNETDDVFREQTKAQFGEPYRTILGHFRHEIGHYYWFRLLSPAWPGGLGGGLLNEARRVFGDYERDYAAARDTHYANGPAGDWGRSHVSAYASMHPLEDWAETFAHYLHIWDAVQTAASFGVLVGGPVDDRTGRRDPALASAPSEDTALLEGFDAVIADWVPLTQALNALNRSLGKDDLYPFELPPAVISKLAFVHRVITAAAARAQLLTNGAPGPGG